MAKQISTARILTDEDFKKIDTELIKKQVQNAPTRRKRTAESDLTVSK